MSLFYVLVLFHTEGPQFQSIVTSARVIRPEKYYFIPIFFFLRLASDTAKELKSLNPIGLLTFKQKNLEL